MDLDYSFQKTYTLIPQSPLIHFQYDQSGATLRATEVKPKLDRYIINRYKREHNGADIPEDWKIPNTPEGKTALKYQMRIRAIGVIKTLELGRHTDYEIYYANMGDNLKKGVWAENKLEISCMIPSLLDAIHSFINGFFVVSNFGTMQDKGFGCYTIKEGESLTDSDIANLLKSEYDCKKCYMITGRTQKELFRNIRVIYNTLKAGNAFSPKTDSILFRYMDKKYHIKSEKDWLKKRASASQAKYVRALLGIGDHMGPVNRPTTVQHTILKLKKAGKDINGAQPIERVPSPIWFTVYDNKAFYVSRKIPEIIYGAEFDFDSSDRRLNSGRLRVPDSAVIGQAFLDNFLDFAYKQFKTMKQIKFITVSEV